MYGVGHQRAGRGCFRTIFVDGGAAQIAPVDKSVEIRAAMKRAAIVPDHQIAFAPFVGLDKLRLRREGHQLRQQRFAFRFSHANNAQGVLADIKRLAPIG